MAKGKRRASGSGWRQVAPLIPVALFASAFTVSATDNPVIATEFCGTSITSSSRPQSRTDQYVAQNPHIKFGRSDRRGLVMMEVTPARTTARFQALDDVRRADSGISTIARFTVEDGRPGIITAG